MKIRLIQWPILFLVLFFSCTINQPSKTKHNDTITVAWSKGINTLDPACAVGIESAEVVTQMYEGLVYTDITTHEIRPLLAETWVVSSDGLVWDFTLRSNVRFHDGTPLDATAVVFSFRRQMDAVRQQREGKNTAAATICGYDYWKAYFDDIIQSVKTIGPMRVRFVLKYPYAPFLQTLEMFAVSIVRPFDVATPDILNHRSLGTGPFRLAGRVADRIVLNRNNDYWNVPNKPTFKTLVFTVIPENRQRLLALEGERLDIAFHLDPARYLTIRLHPLLQLMALPSNNTVYIALNTKREPFSIRQFRLAINHAIDRNKIVKLVYQGMAQLAQAPVPPDMRVGKEPIFHDNDPLLQWPEYNPEKARQLLQEAGYGTSIERRPFTLYFIQSPRTYLPDPLLMANMIRHDLEQVGIPVDIKPMEYMEYKRVLKAGLHDMAIHGWVAEITDPDEYLYGLLHGSNVLRRTGTNHAFFQNYEYDVFVNRARQEQAHPQQRVALYRKALAIFHSEVPWVPMAHARLVITSHRRIKNIHVSAGTFMHYNLLQMVQP